MDLEDSDSDCAFHPGDWIEQGKSYKDVPTYVAKALVKITQLPPAFDSLLAHRDTPVLEFIKQDLPKQSSKLTTTPITAWFSRQSPMGSTHDITLNMVTRRTVPSKHVLLEIERALGQEWFDGCKSIVDPRYNQGTERLPFWILSLWRRFASMAEKQSDWKEAVDFWAKEIVEEWGTVLGGVGWNSKLQYGGFVFTTHRFAQLLSRRQLCDDVTQVMIDHLRDRLEKTSEKSSQHIIAPSRFYLSLEALANQTQHNKGKIPSPLMAVENMVKNEGRTHLWYPVLHSSHEVAIRINFKQRTIAYGKQLSKKINK